MIIYDPETEIGLPKPVVMYSSSYLIGAFAEPPAERNEYPYDLSILIPTKPKPSYRILETNHGPISVEINQVLPPPRH